MFAFTSSAASGQDSFQQVEPQGPEATFTRSPD